MISIYPIIPALFLVLLASYYSQNYAGILASPLTASENVSAQKQGQAYARINYVTNDNHPFWLNLAMMGARHC